jgi:hypothetical protein
MLFYAVRVSFWADKMLYETVISEETGCKFKEYIMKKMSIAIINATEFERSLR